ncbi:hypothetical protein Lal_00014806 [Lupinus albus]|nr:hypothetical protein Lal_00014806 [Lupinus albus]
MLDGGADPKYLGRRIVRMAWEDIGIADPRAIQLANDAVETYERLGSPEGELALGQAVIYLAIAAKSNAGYNAFNAAMAFVRKDKSREVPVHLRNAPTKLMKELGYGHEYRYAHDEPHAYAAGETYLPDGMPEPGWYQPVPRGIEAKIAEKLAWLRSLDDDARAGPRRGGPPISPSSRAARRRSTVDRPSGSRHARRTCVTSSTSCSCSMARNSASPIRSRRSASSCLMRPWTAVPAKRWARRREHAAPATWYNCGFDIPPCRIPTMIDIQLLRKDIDNVAARLASRKYQLDVAGFNALEAERKAIQTRQAQFAVQADRHAERQGRRHQRRDGGSGRHRRRAEGQRDPACPGAGQAGPLHGRDPEPAAPFHAGGPGRVGQRGSPQGGHAAHVRFRREGPRRRRRPAGSRFRHGDQADRLPLRRDERRHRPPAPRAGAIHAGHAHGSARLHGVLHAVHGQCGFAARHGPAAEVRGRPVRREKGRRGRRGREFLPDPDVRSVADEHGARRDRRGGIAADQNHGAHPVLPLGSGQLRTRHARHDPPAPVRQGRARANRASGTVVRRAGRNGGSGRDGPEEPGPAVPRDAAVHGRHGLFGRENLRPGSVAAGAEHVPRDLVAVELRRLPGPPHAGPFPQREGQAGATAHAERLGPGRGPHTGRRAGELPAGGWQCRRAGGAAAVHGRTGAPGAGGVIK